MCRRRRDVERTDLKFVLLQVGDAAMVMSLSGLEEVEDRNLLAGSLMVLLEQDINQAQVCGPCTLQCMCFNIHTCFMLSSLRGLGMGLLHVP